MVTESTIVATAMTHIEETKAEGILVLLQLLLQNRLNDTRALPDTVEKSSYLF